MDIPHEHRFEKKNVLTIYSQIKTSNIQKNITLHDHVVFILSTKACFDIQNQLLKIHHIKDSRWWHER